ncbi:hypothetical protein DIPPA_22989 [Diplonema papillatum]|nr:hypothetical protein DIPPA_22989 [Diplonema papillatum]
MVGGDAKVKGKSCTHAMGMGASTLAVECWKAQVNKENHIRAEWRKEYAPHLDGFEQTIGDRWTARLNDTKQRISEMDESVRTILFDGVSKDGAGRAAYLKLRNKECPQRKQSHPLTTSQTIGWQCQELPPVRQSAVSNFGRKPIIKNGFYRKGGVFTTN